MDADDESMDQAMGIMFSKLPAMSVELREQKLFQVFHSLSLPFFVVLTFVVFIYLIGSLYEDRKDRSILFWNSMPVSNTATVLIKLVTALVAVPAVYLVCAFIVQVLFLLVVSIAAMGHDIEWWQTRTWRAGGVCLVDADLKRGTLAAGADPRRPCYALGW